jgi:hypothetical protein
MSDSNQSKQQPAVERNNASGRIALANGRAENFSRGVITEGREVRGGVGSVPNTAKPQIAMVAQKPAAPVATAQTTNNSAPKR